MAYLHRHVPRGRKLTFPGQRGVDRARALLTELGDPQEQLRVIHVAGTSGKGSTATIITALLRAHGFRVGLHLSPYLLDIRERIQLDGKLISKDTFVTVVKQVSEAAEAVATTHLGQPTYFELLVAAAFLAFRRARVDYAVIETGMGGLYDGTNVVLRSDKLCVLTPIDVDHVHILGTTLAENARQKAGIIHSENTVVSTIQVPDVWSVIEQRVAEVDARLIAAQSPTNVRVTIEGTRFDLGDRTDLQLALVGQHQAQNAALAITTLEILATRDHFAVSESSLRDTLARTTFAGRFDVRTLGERTVIFDGAHSPQKMRSLVATLRDIDPRQRWEFLVAFREGKDVSTMLNILEPVARHMTGTTFGTLQDSVIQSVDQDLLGAALQRCDIPTEIVSDPVTALASLVRSPGRPIVVTGSLYLISALLTDRTLFTGQS